MYKGIILMLASALAFAVSTVFTKLVTKSTAISGIEISLFRFLLGFMLTAIYVYTKKVSLRPNNFKFILHRTVFNTIAVMLFFTGIQYTTITNANMLNMTYPVFVFIAAPLINREKSRWSHLAYLVLTLAGALLIINPSFDSVNYGDVYSLFSGLVAGLAISSLREARKFDDSSVILFYMMGLGSVMNLIAAVPSFIMPHGESLVYIILSAATGFLGQIWLTVGYRYIDASPGALLSASRILFAGILGISLLGDPVNIQVAAGGVFILISLTGVSGIFDYLHKMHRSKGL